MADPRDELRAIADLTRTLPQRRYDAVEAARAAGITWREIAETLGMTQHGLIKAQDRGRPEV